MSEVITLSLALLTGVCLGLFYFGGLWWTVEKGLTAQNPAVLFLASLLVRTAIVLVGFYFLARDHWSGLVAAFVGFLVARVFVVRRLSHPPAHSETPVEEETTIAP
jgi:F1F0 ATPase subunit 2